MLGVLVAALAGPAVAVALAAGGGPEITPVTIGSTTGSPNDTICLFMIDCTYVPYTGVTPELQVPLDGTVTSFSINSGSMGNTVELRVLRPAASGQFTAISTGPAETLSTIGPQSFNVSLPVNAGDVIALDNSDSAIVFDNSAGTNVAWYYQPALSDGSTAAPTNQKSPERLLVSATILPNPSTTSTSTSPTTSTVAPPPPEPPTISHLSQAHSTWRTGSKLSTISRAKKPPIGTTFKFDLNEAARVSFAFAQRLSGRKVKGKCVALTNHDRSARKCTRSRSRGTLSLNAPGGADKVAFDGRVSRTNKLKPGSYTVNASARNSAGERSRTDSLKFKIAS